MWRKNNKNIFGLPLAGSYENLLHKNQWKLQQVHALAFDSWHAKGETRCQKCARIIFLSFLEKKKHFKWVIIWTAKHYFLIKLRKTIINPFPAE